MNLTVIFSISNLKMTESSENSTSEFTYLNLLFYATNVPKPKDIRFFPGEVTDYTFVRLEPVNN